MALDRAGNRRVAGPGAAGCLFLLAVLLVVTFQSWSTPTSLTPVSGVRIAAAIPPWNTWTCNPNNPSPAALAISAANPTHPAPAGSVLSVVYQFKLVGYNASDRGVVVDLPSAKAVFPLAPTGTVSVTLVPKTIAVTTGKWITAPALHGKVTLVSNTSFGSGAAYLSTSKAAVMADAPSGSVTLAFRWHWTVTPPTGRVRGGPWTVPSLTASLPYLPSIFYPAPFVGIVSSTSSPAPAGSTFNITLDGAVANTSFRVVLEYPNNGTEIQSIWENSTIGVTQYNATVPLAFRNGSAVPASNYLIHIHDVCEAIVRMLPVTAS